MTPANQNRTTRRQRRALVLTAALGLVATLASAGAPSTPPFDKLFDLDTIGAGSTSMLIFTIGPSPVAASDLAFSDTLPAGVTLASPGFVSNSCGGTVSAPDGGTTISLTGGMVGLDQTCTIVVNTTSSTVGTHMNVSGDLTSSAGNSGTATADLTVDFTLAGFSKSFSPSTVPFGGRTTLTFLIDNPISGGFIGNLDFTDDLPAGMVVANPSNATTDCNPKGGIPPAILTATPGSTTITLDANGAASAMFNILAAGESCTVVVDVIGGGVGDLGNVSMNLLAEGDEVGKAAAVLEVTGFEGPIALVKEFTDDPVEPGDTVTLEFTILNRSRTDAATMIAFSDDLGATLEGLAPAGPLPAAPCGAGSSLSFTPGTPPSAVLALTGGSLAPEASCTFSVVLDVPGSATPGDYPNTTSAITADVGGLPEMGDPAGDLLFIVAPPDVFLTKEFTTDPVGAGSSVTLEFTIKNNAPDALDEIAFTDDLNTAIPGLAANVLYDMGADDPDPLIDPCGSGSELTISDPLPMFLSPDPTVLVFTGGSLTAAGTAGDTCTFSIPVDVPAGVPGGVYTNITSDVTGELPGMTPTGGPPASGDLVVYGAPLLSKEFTDDPVVPGGGSVTLELTLFYDAEEGIPEATAIAFSDDLKSVLPGTPDLSAASLVNGCAGSTVDITTDPTVIDFSGGSLMPGESCTVTVTVTVPAGAPIGSHTNLTSDVTADVDGTSATGEPAEDDLEVTPLVFSKEFTDDPVVPGQGVTLAFTFTNLGASPADDATDIAFTDSLSTTLSGLTNSGGAPSFNDCGGSEGGTMTSLSYSGGSLMGGDTCTVIYDLSTPSGAADGDYANVTSSQSATIGGMGVTLPPATDVLTLDSEILSITKGFTNDPVLPGGSVTIEFIVTNSSTTATVTDITFRDDLDATLSGLNIGAGTPTDTCGGGIGLTFPALITYTGGTLGPDSSCTVTIPLSVPDAPLTESPPFFNTVFDLEGKVDTTLDVFGPDDTDELLVQTLTLAKSFTDDPTTATGTATLEFTITNLGADPESGLAFSDDLSAVISGLTATLPPSPDPPCGAGSSLSGTSFLALTGASLAAGGSPGDSCAFSVTVTVPASATGGSFLNTTSELFQSGLPVAAAATDFLDIEPPPTFDKAFAPTEIDVGGVATLTFTIDNTASALAATALDFTDVLPAPMVVATPPMASTDCSGGTLTAVAGSGTVSYTGGSVAAGASCTVAVDVTVDMAGDYLNTSGDLTSSSGNSGSASDTLTALSADLELLKIDVAEPVMTGRYQIYQLVATNLGPDTAEMVEVVDVLPAGTKVVVAEPAADCMVAGAIVTCAGGDLALGESFVVTITAYVELTETPMPFDNLATVSSATADPDLGNNDFSEPTEVILQSGLAMLDDADGNGFPEAAVPLPGSVDVLIKDVDSMTALPPIEVFPDGWALAAFVKKPGLGSAEDGVAVMAVEVATGAAAVKTVAGDTGAILSTAAIPAGFLPVSMTVIPDDGTMRSLIAVGAVSTSGGRGRIFLFDCADGSAAGEIGLERQIWPMGLSSIPSLNGDALAELGLAWVNTVNGNKRLSVYELDGTRIGKSHLPVTMIPLALESFSHCCKSAADELTTLGWDRALDRVRLYTRDGFGAFIFSDFFAIGAQPFDLRSLPSVAAGIADEMAVLYRNFVPKAALQVRDARNGANLLFEVELLNSVPLGLDVSPDTYDSLAEEVSVYWLDPVSGMMFVTVRDGLSGATVATVPIP